MAVTIPDASSIQQNVPSGQTPVASYGQARVPDITQVGQQVSAKAAKVAAEVYARRVDDEVTKAKTQMALARVEQDAAYDTDEDLDTIEERWSSEMTNQLGNAAMAISDGRVREAFIMTQQPSMVEGQVKMRQRVFSRRSDQEMAAAENNTSTLLKAAASPNGDVQVSYDAVASMWENMAVQGYTSHEHAQEMIRNSKVKMAEAKLMTMQPAQQLEALNESWAEELPLNVRESLRIEAETRLRLGQAQSVAYEAIQADMDPSEADDYFFEKLKATPELLSEAQTQFARLKRNRLNSQVEEQSELFSTYDVQIRDGIADGTFSTSQLRADNPDDWAAMTPAMRSNLVALEKALTTGAPRTVSDRTVKAELFRLWSGGAASRTEAKMYFFENSAALSETDYEDFLGKVYGGQPEALFDAQRTVENLTVNMSDKKRAGVYNDITKWYLDFQERNDGAQPSDDEVTDKINRSIIKYDTGWLSRDKTVYEMDIDERVDVYMKIRNPRDQQQFLEDLTQEEADQVRMGKLQTLNPDVYSDVMSVFGPDEAPTYKEFNMLYRRLQQKRAGGE